MFAYDYYEDDCIYPNPLHVPLIYHNRDLCQLLLREPVGLGIITTVKMSTFPYFPVCDPMIYAFAYPTSLL